MANLPNDRALECSIIGSILKKPSMILACDFVNESMFYDSMLSVIYKITNTLYDEGVQEIDDITILTKINEFSRYKNMFDNGDITSVRALFDDLRLMGTGDVEEYNRRCRRLITLDFQRKAYLSLSEQSNKLLNDKYNKDINEVNLEIQDAIMGLAENYLLSSEVELIGSQIKDIRKKIESKNIKGIGAGIPSKFPVINKFFTYERGELVVVGGRAKHIWLAV